MVESTTFATKKDNIPLVRLDFDPQTRIFVLYLLGEQTPDNRLTHEFIREGIVPACQQVQKMWAQWVKEGNVGEGSALVTTALPSNKIFSNGLDLMNAIADPTFFDDYLNVMFKELLSLPIPTVASVGGHAFAGGFTLAAAHDYRVQNGKKGYLCLNEIEFGAPVPNGMMAVLRTVTNEPTVIRKIVLEGHRFGAKEALQHKLIDVIADGPGYEGSEGTLKKSIELAMALRSRTLKNGYKVNRELMFKEQFVILNQPDKYVTSTHSGSICPSLSKLCLAIRVGLRRRDRGICHSLITVVWFIHVRSRRCCLFLGKPRWGAPRAPGNVEDLALAMLPMPRLQVRLLQWYNSRNDVGYAGKREQRGRILEAGHGRVLEYGISRVGQDADCRRNQRDALDALARRRAALGFATG